MSQDENEPQPRQELPCQHEARSDVVNKMRTAVQGLKIVHGTRCFWVGKIRERKEKFQALKDSLNAMFDKQTTLCMEIPSHFKEWTNSFMSSYNYNTRTITLRGRLSVITLLHEYVHSLGITNELTTQGIAVEVFKEEFPEQYARLHQFPDSLALVR